MAFPTEPMALQIDGNAVWLKDDGSWERVRPTGPWGSVEPTVSAHADTGSSLWLTVDWGGDDRDENRALVRYDIPTRRTTLLAGSGTTSEPGKILAVQTIDGLI